MHLHFEKNNNAKCDCNILSLSWMGKVPDESPEVNYFEIIDPIISDASAYLVISFTRSILLTSKFSFFYHTLIASRYADMTENFSTLSL